jgi:hypothetical protein
LGKAGTGEKVVIHLAAREVISGKAGRQRWEKAGHQAGDRHQATQTVVDPGELNWLRAEHSSESLELFPDCALLLCLLSPSFSSTGP